MADTDTDTGRIVEPALKTRFLSHGTLGSRDLERTRKLYTELLGLEVVRTSNTSLLIRPDDDRPTS
jgi:catechol-2,3-dioxygenase